MRKATLLLLITAALFLRVPVFSQVKNAGIITGNLLDEKSKAIPAATVGLLPYSDSLPAKSTSTDKDGNFQLEHLAFGWYQLKLSCIGYKPLVIDSIHLRAERFDFNLTDITLKQTAAKELDEVIVYAEKPLVQSKDGNITFNAGESALSAGSNASDLLKNVPLVTTDPNGKILVRGKEPKILIDDKPVELNVQQLQDFLESLPGSSIEKIEVLTNPPPQYANEQGGVINIVTRKGRVGMGGRLSITGGSRGEMSANANFSYRKNKLALNFNTGFGYNLFTGNGYSRRQNVYADSINYFNAESAYRNKNSRPGARFNLDYDPDKKNSLNLALQFNQNFFHNRNENQYMNQDYLHNIYRLSRRNSRTEGENINPDINFTYTHRGRQAGEVLRVIAGYYYAYNENNRYFFQQFMNPDFTFNGIDSTSQQLSNNYNHGFNLRVNYDKPLPNRKTFFSLGSFFNTNSNHVLVNTSYLKKPDNIYVPAVLQSNDFVFNQAVINYRASIKQILLEGFSLTAGTSAERTATAFDLTKASDTSNRYWTLLPFANLNRTWKDKLSVTLSYRRSIRRPGIGELNPTIDYGDPYTLRFGNPGLEASTSDNIDFVAGRTTDKYYVNLGAGYNMVSDIYQQVRTLLPDGKTQVTWANISSRKEYELSTWSGYTVSKKIRLNFSASYSYNKYSVFDRMVNKYRNGGTIATNLNANYAPSDLLNFNSSFTFNRFANPQGTVGSNVSMNIAVQKKFFSKKLVLTLNIIDPIFQQKNRTFTYGTNFNLESYNSTKTRNYRLTAGYNFSRRAKPKKMSSADREKLQRLMQPK
ncbi:MAG: outer membrane beta-barrel protein [Chitinophagaceae bacterium]